MVGQPRLLVHLDDGPIGLVDGIDDEVDAGHGQVNGGRCRHGQVSQRRMEHLGDILDRGTGVDIGRPADHHGVPYRQHGVEPPTGRLDHAPQPFVEGNVGRPLGLGAAALIGLLDQLGDSGDTVAGHLGRTPQCRRHDFPSDDDRSDVIADTMLLHQDDRPRFLGCPAGFMQLVHGRDPDGHTPALLAARRLDHNRRVLAQKVVVRPVEGGLAARGHDQAGPFQHRAGQELVVTPAEGHGAGQFGQGFEGRHTTASVAQSQLSEGGIDDIDDDAPVERLVDDDPAVAVDLLVAVGNRVSPGPSVGHAARSAVVAGGASRDPTAGSESTAMAPPRRLRHVRAVSISHDHRAICSG